MTNTNDTTATTTTDRDHRVRPARRFGKAVAGIALGAAIGWFAGSASADPSPPAAVEPAAPASAEAPVRADTHGRSPDAIARAAEAERLDRLELCTSSPRSADGIERCVLAG